MALVAAIVLFFALLGAIFFFGYLKYVKPARAFYQLTIVSTELASRLNKPSGHWAGRALSAIGSLLSMSSAEAAHMKKELGAAGFRSDQAVSIFNGIKPLSAAAFLVAGFLLRHHLSNVGALQIVLSGGCGVLGYMAPGLVLARLIARRKEQIRFALPDALDMLVVCSEVGCALDQAIQNVSREFKDVHPALSDELSLINMEILAGASRSTALRNFAERTGEEDVKKLVAIMIQTDRFGTSIADSLRAQSDFMRVRRRQQAEERAGKVGVKLVFPIFFFCMPALMVVVAGPGMLQLFEHFANAAAGTP
ncbi:MAG: type II secretion system F family protein [Bryobacteraceae bacterium]